MAKGNARCFRTFFEYHLGRPNNTLVTKSNGNKLLKNCRSENGWPVFSKVFDMIKLCLETLDDGPICSGIARRQER